MNARKLEKRILCLAVFLVLPLLAAFFLATAQDPQ